MNKSRMVMVGVVLAVVGALGYGIWQSRDRGLPEGLIQANGRLEGDSVLVASKYPGRLESVLVREGDMVSSGQLLASLHSDEVTARLRAAQASLAAAQAQQQRATAAAAQADKDAARFADLLASGSVDRMHAEQMQLAAVSARSVAVQAGEQIHQAEAAVAEASAVLRELQLTAPSAGMVSNRLREPGEMLAAGGGVVELVDLNRLYLKVYVPENQIGKIRLGLPAQISTDAFPEHPFAATVSHIAARAEFTPKEVQTPDERVKLVYAVKLSLSSNPQLRLTPGLPADAVIRWKEGVAWQAPRW